MTKKQTITVRAEECPVYEFTGSLASVKERIEQLIADYGADAFLDYETYYQPYDSNEYQQFFICVKRLETDEEYTARIQIEKEAERQRLERDRMEFERLRKQFGE